MYYFIVVELRIKLIVSVFQIAIRLDTTSYSYHINDKKCSGSDLNI